MGESGRRKLGRPPKLPEKGTSISSHVPVSLALLLEEVARLRRKSVSEVVREALELYLRDEVVRLGLENVFTAVGLQRPPSAPAGQREEDPPVDPLTQLDVEDFEEQLARFEGELAKLKGEADKVKELMQSLGYGHGSRPLPQHLEEYVKRLAKRALALKHEWLRLKGWYRKLPPNHDHAARLVAARRALKEIERLAPQK